jgi:hypothetical protein
MSTLQECSPATTSTAEINHFGAFPAGERDETQPNMRRGICGAGLGQRFRDNGYAECLNGRAYRSDAALGTADLARLVASCSCIWSGGVTEIVSATSIAHCQPLAGSSCSASWPGPKGNQRAKRGQDVVHEPRGALT